MICKAVIWMLHTLQFNETEISKRGSNVCSKKKMIEKKFEPGYAHFYLMLGGILDKLS
jgi:hypothetical protein